MRRRVRAKRQMVYFSGVAEMIKNDSRLNPRDSPLGIDLKNLRHVAREIEHHGNIAALSSERCASAAAKNGSAKFACGRNRRDHVVRVARQNDADRHLPIIRSIRRVERAAAAIEAHISAQIAAQFSFERGGIYAGGLRSVREFGEIVGHDEAKGTAHLNFVWRFLSDEDDSASCDSDVKCLRSRVHAIVSTLTNAKEAKEFLVSKIVSEAQLEGVLLSEIERKELYFSETAWTLPDIERVNEDFEKNCNQGDYERKIVDLIKNARKRDRDASSQEAGLWSDAIEILRKEDHYILVMMREAGISTRPRGDFAKLLATAFVVTALLVCAIALSIRFNVDLSKQAMGFYMWAAAAAGVAAYLLFALFLGKAKTNDLVGRILMKLFTRFARPR